MSSFTDSKSFAFQRAIRADIRRSSLTKGQQAVTTAVVNMWFYHKGGPVREISPGRASLAKKANVTEKTVSRTLSILRAAGVLEAVANERGQGQKRTRYRVRMVPLMMLCGSDIPDWMEGELKPLFGGVLGGKMSHHFGSKCPTTGGTKCPTYIRDASSPIQDEQSCEGIEDLGGRDA